MYATSFTSPYDAANITTTTSDGRPPIVQDFYQDSSGTAAWTAASSTYATAPGRRHAAEDPTRTPARATPRHLASVLNIASPSNSTRDATFESQRLHGL